MHKLSIFILLGVCVSQLALAQSTHKSTTTTVNGVTVTTETTTDEPEDKNLPVTFGGVSPVVLQQGQSEISWTNSYATFQLEQLTIHPELNNALSVENRYRYSRMDNILRFSHGYSRSGRFDLGAELRIGSARLDDRAMSGPFQLLTKASPTGSTVTDLVSIGVRSRIVPFLSQPNLTLQAYAHYPMVRSTQKMRQLNAERLQVGVSANYLRPITDRVYYYLLDDVSQYFSGEFRRTNTIVNTLGGYLLFTSAAQNWFLFPGLNHTVTYQYSKHNSMFRGSRQVMAALGGSWAPTERLNVFGIYNAPLLLESGSDRIEWKQESFVSFALGVRFWMR